MSEFSEIGRLLLVVGAVIAGLGLFLMVADKVSWFGQLPGDIYVEGDGYSFYFPITTCILLSLVLSLLMYFFGRY